VVGPYLAPNNNKAEPVHAGTNILVDSAGQLVERYGNTPAFYLVGPDGYIAFRCLMRHRIAFCELIFPRYHWRFREAETNGERGQNSPDCLALKVCEPFISGGRAERLRFFVTKKVCQACLT
jgi:hypothetical protein